MKKTLLVASLLFGAASAFTQDSTNLLDPVTVTATVSPAQTSKTGRNIIVIKGEQFSKLPVNSLDELLRYVPGIEVQARGPMGSQSDIIIRGGTFQQVLVVLDGIRLNDPLTGHFNSYMPIAPAEIDRIEILKGASSAIYGTEAVGGVIHIITKSFAQTVKKSSALAQITTGEYGLLTMQAGGHFTDGKNTLSGGLISNHTNGQPQRGTKGYFDLSTGSLSYARKVNEHWNLALRSAYDSRSFSAQNYYTSFASDTATETVKTWWNHAQATYNSSLVKWQVNVGYKTVSDHYRYNTRSVANDNQSNLFQFLSTTDIALSKKTSFTTGLQYISKGIASNDRGDHSVWQSAAFVVLHQSIGNHLFLDPALRFDYNEKGGFELVPQLNASYRTKNYQLRTSVGRTIRDADFTERFNNYNKTLVTGGRIGNPNLEAETSLSFEIGGDVSLNNKIKISGTWFQRFHQKLIDYITTPYSQMPRKENLSPTGTYALAKNFSRVNTAGWETDIQFQQPLNNKQQLTANIGFLWLNSKLDGGGNPGFYLSSHARFMTNFSILYHYDWLSISVNGLYKTRQPQEAAAIHAVLNRDYFVINAKADVSIKKWAGVFIQLDNIGNTSYSDLLGTPMPGRWLMGGIRCNF